MRAGRLPGTIRAPLRPRCRTSAGRGARGRVSQRRRAAPIRKIRTPQRCRNSCARAPAGAPGTCPSRRDTAGSRWRRAAPNRGLIAVAARRPKAACPRRPKPPAPVAPKHREVALFIVLPGVCGHGSNPFLLEACLISYESQPFAFANWAPHRRCDWPSSGSNPETAAFSHALQVGAAPVSRRRMWYTSGGAARIARNRTAVGRPFP